MKKKKLHLNKKGKRVVLGFSLFIGIALLVFPLKNQFSKKIPKMNEETDYYAIHVNRPETGNKVLQKEIDSWIDNSIVSLKEDAKEDKKILEELNQKYELTIQSNVSNYMDVETLKLEKEVYNGGNHQGIETYVKHIDEMTNEEKTLKDYFKDDYLEDLLRIITFKVIDYYKDQDMELDEEWINNGVMTITDNYTNFFFDDLGLHITFDRYVVGPWSMGSVSVLVPYKDIAELLNFSVQVKVQELSRDLSLFKDKKLVAITFDDGPSVNTNYLLSELRKRDMLVTFFMLGERVNAYPEVVKEAYHDGHEIASHTFHHKNLSKLTPYEVYREVEDTNEAIYKTIGVYPTYIRPPYGSTNKEVRKIIHMHNILWSVDTEDWRLRNAEKVYKEIMKNAEDGAIILLHDLYKTSVDGALKAMDELSRQGYLFVTVRELVTLKDKTLNFTDSYFSF